MSKKNYCCIRNRLRKKKGGFNGKKKVKIDKDGEVLDDKREFSEKKQHGSYHHIFPTSRGGPRDEKINKYIWPGQTADMRREKHAAWHRLFHNLLPSEAIKIILEWTTNSGELDSLKMGENNINAWKTAFDGSNPYDVIAMIIKKFIPVEIKCFEIISGSELEKEKQVNLGALLEEKIG